jgi:hypothetical protein
MELHRAAAYLRLVELLAERRQGTAGDPELAEALQHALAACRRAEALLSSRPGPVPDVGPEGQSPAVWLTALRRRGEELTKLHRPGRLGESSAAQSEPVPAFLPLTDRGVPVRWRGQPARSERPPAPVVQSAAEGRRQEALVASELLLAALLCVWILSHLSRLATLLRRLWPEQVLLIAFLGWEWLGPSLVGVVLVALAVTARVLLLASWLGGLVRARSPVAVTASGHAPVP